MGKKVEDGYRVHMTLDSMPITNHALQESAGGTGGGDSGAAGKAGGAGGVQTGFPLG